MARKKADKKFQWVEKPDDDSAVKAAEADHAAAYAATTPAPETILEEATRIVNNARRNQYGHPKNNFAVIAAMWNAYLDNRKRRHAARGDTLDGPFRLESVDVAHMMALMKLARLSEDPAHRDSMVDVCGYEACAGAVIFDE